MGLLKKMKNYVKEDYISAHMPGHKSGKLISDEIKDSFGENVFRFDITEIIGMDNLQNPLGIIKELEKKIANITGAEEAFILVNGSTSGLLSVIYSMAKNKKIFVGGNSHQAVYNAMIISGSIPIFLTPEIEEDTGTELGVAPETLIEAINLYPDCEVLILTLPNYYGIRYKYKEILSIARERKLKIIIDEAHGAHFNFIGEDYPNGIALGANAVVQSWHKTLPVLNQGSVLLSGKESKDYNFRESINLFQTTSPSYLIMSTIDSAADFLIGKKNDIIKSGKKWKNFFKKLELKNLKIFTYKESESDPFKLLVYLNKKADNLTEEIIVEKYKIQPEIIDKERLLFMLPLLFDEELAIRIQESLIELDIELNNYPGLIKHQEVGREKVFMITKTPQELNNLEKKVVPILESSGKICAQKVLKYPPGVPLLFPGEVLTEEIVCYLNRHKINYSLQEGIQIYIDQEN